MNLIKALGLGILLMAISTVVGIGNAIAGAEHSEWPFEMDDYNVLYR